MVGLGEYPGLVAACPGWRAEVTGTETMLGFSVFGLGAW